MQLDDDDKKTMRFVALPPRELYNCRFCHYQAIMRAGVKLICPCGNILTEGTQLKEATIERDL